MSFFVFLLLQMCCFTITMMCARVKSRKEQEYHFFLTKTIRRILTTTNHQLRMKQFCEKHLFSDKKMCSLTKSSANEDWKKTSILWICVASESIIWSNRIHSSKQHIFSTSKHYRCNTRTQLSVKLWLISDEQQMCDHMNMKLKEGK